MMARRWKNWEESLAKELKKSKKARLEFFNALLEEGYNWREALNHIIRVIGVKEYAEMIEIRPSNLINQLKKNSNVTLSTIEKISQPIGKISINLTK